MFTPYFDEKIMGIPVIKLVFEDPFTDEDMKKLLSLISKFLEKKKLFCFYADIRKASRPPRNTTIMLIQWMKENKQLFKQYLICSAVILSNSTTNIVVKNLLTGAFKIQPPASPNKIFTNFDKGMLWINEKIKEYVTINEKQN